MKKNLNFYLFVLSGILVIQCLNVKADAFDEHFVKSFIKSYESGNVYPANITKLSFTITGKKDAELAFNFTLKTNILLENSAMKIGNVNVFGNYFYAALKNGNNWPGYLFAKKGSKEVFIGIPTPG